jgi:hypothetical protein
MMVRRLLKTLPLTGRFLLTVSRAHSTHEIMCAFEARAADPEDRRSPRAAPGPPTAN